MKLTIIILTLFPFFCIAQKGFNISISGDFGKTSLLNKEDKNAGEILDFVPTSGYQMGGNLGYRKEIGGGFAGLNVGVKYSHVGQKYKGRIVDPVNDSTTIIYLIKGQINLNYITIPMELNYTLFKNKRIRPTFSLGCYFAFNKSYSDKWEQINTYNQDVSKFSYNNLDYTQSHFTSAINYTVSSDYKLDKPYYSKIDYGWVTRLGIEFEAFQNCTISVNGTYNRGLKDVENKTEILYSGQFPMKKNPWEYLKYKNGTNGSVKRSKTYNSFLGASLTITYFLFNSKSQKNQK
ncbi:MAG: outer membrane beta-barrel protein [Bacteroidetes bacterium]|nr:outer membrane beta-barrel protein [Bacteroidota bacterium]MBK8144292.1 outer membrane beta-barrel protein [Bacteroidota bacterium]MBP6314246.1 outer membrane beta-barrel protein [Chitinophagaceae bacterium]